MSQVPSKSSNTTDIKTTSADETPTEIFSPKTYSDLVSTLPTRGGWATPFVLYQNYWFVPPRLQHSISVKEHYKPRSDDIILATYPKCGTTWLKALAFTITTRSHHDLAGHPLLIQHPQKIVPHLEIPPLAGGLADVEKLPSPRLLATHLPLSLLPPAVATRSCRVVYLCRHPKDAFISLWCFMNKMHKGSPVELGNALSLFCEGISPMGPFWRHYLEFWKESLVRPQEILFLKYEEIVSDPVKVVKKLASFCSVPFTEEEERGGVIEEVVRLCSFEMLSGLEQNQAGDVDLGDDLAVGKSAFFRKGKVGDWENHMTKEMGRKLDFFFCFENTPRRIFH